MLNIIAGVFAGGAAPTSYESIATTTVGSGGTATITFSSIPATYTHLQIRGIGRSTTANTGVDNVYVTVNSDSGANYARHHIIGNGTTASASAASSTNQAVLGDIARNNNTSGMFGAFVIDILDYANTNKYKTVRSILGYEQNTSDGGVNLNSGNWRSTSAITSIKLYPASGNFNQYSSFALYGVKA